MQDYGIRERRLVFWLKEVGSNIRSLGQEISMDASEAAHGSDPIKFAMAPVVGAARVILKGPTNVLLGLFDKKVQPFNGFETGQTLRETGHELAGFHPLRAGIHAFNIVDSAFLDVLRSVGGFTGKTRSHIARVLNESSVARRN